MAETSQYSQVSGGRVDYTNEEDNIRVTTNQRRAPPPGRAEVIENGWLSLFGYMELGFGIIALGLSAMAIAIVETTDLETVGINATMGTPINYSPVYASHALYCGLIIAICGAVAISSGKKQCICCCVRELPRIHKINMIFCIISCFAGLILMITASLSSIVVTYSSLEIVHGIQAGLGALSIITCIVHAVYCSYYVKKYKKEKNGGQEL